MEEQLLILQASFFCFLSCFLFFLVLLSSHKWWLVFASPGQELGLEDFSPPYLAPTTSGPVILQGVNYASSGILNVTGKIFVRLLLHSKVNRVLLLSRFYKLDR